eukprot:jgi/Mesvir1/25521/Mv01771-RA.1
MQQGPASFLAGVAGGLSEVLIGHPFDTVKTRLQIQTQHAHSRPGRALADFDNNPPFVHYTGPLHCAVTMWRREGLGSFYRGVRAPMIQKALGASLLFGLMDFLRGLLGANLQHPGWFLLACTIVGIVESLVYTPLDLIKARLQAHSSPLNKKSDASHASPRNYGVLRCVADVVRANGGIGGLYRGYTLQALKEVVGNVALFGTYDVAVTMLLGSAVSSGEHVSAHHAMRRYPHAWLRLVPAGSIAGIAYFTAGMPFDTVKSCVQTDSLEAPRYKGALHCAACILREEGVRHFYRGLSMCLMRAIPGFATQFFVYELVFTLLTTSHPWSHHAVNTEKF